MDSLSITDSDGDRLRFEARDGIAVAEINDSDGVLIGSSGAQEIVDWLTDVFDLAQFEAPAAQAIGAGLEISVETETGKTRTVRWYGPDVPGELVRLSEVALRVYDRGADVAPDCEHLTTMRAVYHMVSGLGLRRQVGAYDAVEALVEEFRKLRREASAHLRPEPESLAVLRQLCATLGLDRAGDIPARVEKLISEINAVAAALASATDTTIGPDGVDLVTLVRKLRQRHAMAILKLKAGHHDAIKWAERASVRREQEALSKERDARAAVQVELDTLKIQRQNAEEAEAAARAKLELAREALRSVEKSSAPGGADTLNIVRTALERTASR